MPLQNNGKYFTLSLASLLFQIILEQHLQCKTYFAATFLQSLECSERYTVSYILGIYGGTCQKFVPSNEMFSTEKATLLANMAFNTIGYYFMTDNEIMCSISE